MYMYILAHACVYMYMYIHDVHVGVTRDIQALILHHTKPLRSRDSPAGIGTQGSLHQTEPLKYMYVVHVHGNRNWMLVCGGGV